MNNREKIISNCFNSWITKSISTFCDSFADNAVYIESWGPGYKTKERIMAWFEEWNINNNVLIWDINHFYHTGDLCVCEWYFKCECAGSIDDFNGVSLITLNEEDKIVLLKEYQSKTPNYYPYE
jgi:hypothetical protein